MIENITIDVYIKILSFLIGIKLALIGFLAKIGLNKFKNIDNDIAAVRQKTNNITDNMYAIQNTMVSQYSSKDEVKSNMESINARFDKIESQYDLLRIDLNNQHKELTNKLDDNFKLMIDKIDKN